MTWRRLFPATTDAWRRLWWWWLFGIAVSFVVLEGGSLVAAHLAGAQHIQDWTLSDTIRRWAMTWRNLAAIVSGFAILLLVHWFGTKNPD